MVPTGSPSSMAVLTASRLKLVLDRRRVNVHAPSPPPDATTCCRSLTGAPRYSLTSPPVPLAGSNRVVPAGVWRAAGTSTLSTHWASFGSRLVISVRAGPAPPPPPFPAGGAGVPVLSPPPSVEVCAVPLGPPVLAPAPDPLVLAVLSSSPPNRPPK